MRRAYECSGTLDSGLEENWALRMSVRKFAFIVAVSLVPIAGYATIVDLTGSNDSGGINGAQFVFTTHQPTGTRRNRVVLAHREHIDRTTRVELRLMIRLGGGRTT